MHIYREQTLLYEYFTHLLDLRGVTTHYYGHLSEISFTEGVETNQYLSFSTFYLGGWIHTPIYTGFKIRSHI